MANQPPRSNSPKDKDDDSWGKLASDLFGIQFNASDDDFDLTEDEPITKATVPEAPPGPTLADVVPLAAASSPVQVHEPNLSFDEGLEAVDTAPRDVEPPQEAERGAPVQVESEKDIWDLLESWNWDEPARRSADRQTVSESRPNEEARSQSPRRGDRDSRRERGAERERPEEPSDQPRAARPRREDSPRRGAKQGDRQRSEQPSDRPTGQRDEAERRQQRSPQSRESESPRDEFDAEVDVASDSSIRERSKSAPQRGGSPPRPQAPRLTDDFEGDLFAEIEAQSTEEVADTGEARDSIEPSEGTDEKRRRRRRRRKGVRNRREETLQPTSDSDELSDPVSYDDSPDDDSESSESPELSEIDADEVEREPRRKRRRRRTRRRNEEFVERSEVQDQFDDEEEVGISGEDSIEEDLPEEDEELVVAVSYEGIPSWEEAISYLQRRPRESRPRGDGSSRGRGGPHRR